MLPEVSVIVPNYNHARYLKQRIDSILNQTFQNFELIILDDMSTDHSRDLIDEYRYHPKIKGIVYNDRNSGSTFAQWEKGLTLAKADWVWIAESDDYASPIFLETLVKMAKQGDNIGIAFCDSHWVDHASEIKESLSLFKESFFHTGVNEIRNALCKHCTIQNASSAVIKKDLALKAIYQLSKYRACGDWIFYTRILHESNLIYTTEKLNYFRWYHSNISNSGKDTLWATEGVQVLENIDYHKVGFDIRYFVNVILHWLKKTRRLNFNNRLKTWHSLAQASLSYLHTKA